MLGSLMGLWGFLESAIPHIGNQQKNADDEGNDWNAIMLR